MELGARRTGERERYDEVFEKNNNVYVHYKFQVPLAEYTSGKNKLSSSPDRTKKCIHCIP